MASTKIDPEHLAQLRRFLPVRDGDPVQLARVLCRDDDTNLCAELVAMGLLARKRHPNRSLKASQYLLTDAGIEAAGYRSQFHPARE
jgi:hypothetical protein